MRDDLTPEQLADLVRLADDTLEGTERAEAEARVAASPELARELAAQRKVVVAMREAARTEGAPARLRARIEAERKQTAPARRRRKFALSSSLAGALAAGALALVLTLPGGTPGAPTLAEAAAVGARPAAQPAPGFDASDPKLLDIDQSGIAFPAWAEKFKWRATGSRTDEVDGRDTTTVFYERDGRRIAYTIVSGDALDVPGSATTTTAEGTTIRIVRRDGQTIVTWLRDGKTCILTGDAKTENLVALAGWKGKGSVEF